MNGVKAKAMVEYEKQSKNILNNLAKGEQGLDKAQVFRYTGVKEISEIPEMLKDEKWLNTLVGQTSVNKYMPAARKAFENRLRLG